MFPRHRRDSQTRRLLRFRLALDLDHHLLIRVEPIHLREVVIVAFGGQVAFCVWSADDREVATEGFFDFLVEVVSSWCQLCCTVYIREGRDSRVIMREKNQVDAR